MHSPKLGAVLYAKRLDPVARFYERVLGMPVAHAAADHVILESDAFEFVIHAIPSEIADTFEIADPPEVREETPIKLLFPVARIDEARAIAASLGGRIQPIEREWASASGRVCDGVDPEGNVFQLRQRP
ncbi:VOC family protein [Mitsuaria sp. GD03876]|uniref:VOC family protein n=1 Tax=Mitsuaria sp. GD03876 TaxID=2975399 RepID=UPI002448D13F|nr:VOC family protein [Mitsuaria sp. GD03876]MDH0863348.1 hypothetical protein [Mitsuaria sp. GD03876]